MSVQKIEIVKKSRKDQGKCSKCAQALPVGSGYLYWNPGFRSNYKIVRCLAASCVPRPSERETSKVATILAAQENFQDVLESLDTPEDIESAVADVATAAEEVKDEYEEALGQWENGNEQLQEKVDHYESQHSELDGWSWDGETDYTLCDEHVDREDQTPDDEIENCDGCQSNREEWIQECRDAADEMVENIEFA